MWLWNVPRQKLCDTMQGYMTVKWVEQGHWHWHENQGIMAYTIRIGVGEPL